MFFSLQIIWYPIVAVFSLVRRILWPRAPPKHDIEILDRPSTLRSESFDSTATTIKQASSHVKVIEVPTDCSEHTAKEGGGND